MRRATRLAAAALLCATFAHADPPRLMDEAMRLAGEARHAEALARFEQARREAPETIEAIHGLKIAVLLAAEGDAAAHEAHARWLVERHPAPETATDAERSVKGYLLPPWDKDPGLLAHAVAMTRLATDRAEAAGEGELLPWFQLSRGIAAYRAGDAADARAWLEKTLADESPYIRGLARAFHAMAAHHAGDAGAARASLHEARALADAMPAPGTPEYAKEWTDTLAARMALAEADALIGGGDTP